MSHIRRQFLSLTQERRPRAGFTGFTFGRVKIGCLLPTQKKIDFKGMAAHRKQTDRGERKPSYFASSISI